MTTTSLPCHQQCSCLLSSPHPPGFVVSYLLENSQSHRYEVIAYCCFDLCSLIRQHERLFQVPFICHLYYMIISGQVYIQILGLKKNFRPHPPGSAKDLVLALCSEITAGGTRNHMVVKDQTQVSCWCARQAPSLPYLHSGPNLPYLKWDSKGLVLGLWHQHCLQVWV